MRPGERASTATSTAGNLSRDAGTWGFTLIELIVVVCIISMMLVFSFPLIRDVNLISDSEGDLADVIHLINDLKRRAMEDNTDYVLHVDSVSNRVWVTNSGMDDRAKQAAMEKSARLSGDLVVFDVEYPGGVTAGNNEYEIRFSKKGYSDFAMIHVMANGSNLTLRIEPFLSRLRILKSHVHFEDCM